MDKLLDNILMMRHHGQAQLAGVGASPSLLEEIRDLAVAEMSEAFSHILERTAGELLDLAGRNPSHVMYCLYMDSREQVQSQRESMASTFKRRLFQRFNEARRRGHLAHKDPLAPETTELNLVEPEELELTLAGSTISHALRIACSAELPGLDRRLGLLLEDQELRFGPNPLGPEIVGESVMDAIKDLPTSNKVKLMLVSRLNVHLPGHIIRVYEEINRRLVGRGVLPSIKPEIRRAQSAPASAGASTSQAVEPVKPQKDMFSMLQQLMSMGRIGGVGGVGGVGAGFDIGTGPSLPALSGGGMGEAANEGEIDSVQVVQRLTRIQQGELSNVPGGNLDPAVLANGHINVLRAIKHTGAAGNMGHMDAMTLDIVALMFDYILDDPRLPDGMKALIGRLQIPILKVAMLDKAFFSQRSHPARKLLDTLADAALGWNEQEGKENALFRTVEALIQQVLDEYEDNVEVFVQALENLRKFLEEEKRLADERACQRAQVLQRNEQAALARSIALEAVQTRLLDNEAPEFVLLFLQGPWATHLANLYMQAGTGGDGWTRALATMDDLLWSLAPKSAKEERQKLVLLLPKLLRQLDEGIHAVELPQTERDHFFANLVKYHAEAVKPSPRAREAAVSIEVARKAVAPVTPSVAFAFDSPEFHDIPAPAEQLETDPLLLSEISMVQDQQAEAEEIIIGDVIGQDRLALETGDLADYEKQVQQLKRGAWLEFTLEDKSTLRAKLAWVSPLRGTYLFTNRLGERAVSINAAGLAQKMKEGSAKIVDSVALIDRAVSSLFERLQKTS